MLLEDGEMIHIGDPEKAGREYLQINFERVKDEIAGRPDVGYPDIHARLVEAWIENASGERTDEIGQSEPLRLVATIEARRELIEPNFKIICSNKENVTVFELDEPLDGGQRRLAASARTRIDGTIENPLTPGNYNLRCVVGRAHEPEGRALQSLNLLDFTVRGSRGPDNPVVSVRADLKVIAQERGV
jgi:hypothetical protein